jgi:hypothetical protein
MRRKATSRWNSLRGVIFEDPLSGEQRLPQDSLLELHWCEIHSRRVQPAQVVTSSMKWGRRATTDAFEGDEAQPIHHLRRDLLLERLQGAEPHPAKDLNKVQRIRGEARHSRPVHAAPAFESECQVHPIIPRLYGGKKSGFATVGRFAVAADDNRAPSNQPDDEEGSSPRQRLLPSDLERPLTGHPCGASPPEWSSGV